MPQLIWLIFSPILPDTILCIEYIRRCLTGECINWSLFQWFLKDDMMKMLQKQGEEIIQASQTSFCSPLCSDISAPQVTVSVGAKCLWHTLEAISNVSTGGNGLSPHWLLRFFTVSASDPSFQSLWLTGDASQLESASGAAARWSDFWCSVEREAYMTDSPCLVRLVRSVGSVGGVIKSRSDLFLSSQGWAIRFFLGRSVSAPWHPGETPNAQVHGEQRSRTKLCLSVSLTAAHASESVSLNVWLFLCTFQTLLSR